ncbi:exodeoxyribonuclease V subunit beta [Neisseria sp. 74A18]|uniref:exodeoxyribonuclease V subunit beta n=1 Tax=Neisseria sp. 74A18 TaxID=1696094 RepID=UPI0006CAD8D0|nr:exodeoxyribonuclease V subunit beta [Neisseria sp. 74A18]KPN73301.1 exodeoxyribonuclease V subunit beta [Neisseria sp. 74A18]
MPAQPFNPLTIPISGTSLIEASAGTGKTYGIAALFTRLIVLEKMPVESVLVVTFTKAATAELKTRLRARLDDVLSVLENVPDAAHHSDGLAAYCAQHHEGDVFLPNLLEAALQQESQERLIVRLKAAISRFDNAAIYTIHGFCQRLLRDYAFFCQAPFDVELTEDSRERLLVPAQDFWRENVSHNPLLAKLVFEHHHTPETMLSEIKSFIGRPYLAFRRPESNMETAQKTLAECWENIRTQLPELVQTFWTIHPVLNGNKYRKNTFQNVFALLEAAAESNTLPSNHDKLPLFAADALEAATKKTATPDTAAFARLNILARLGECFNGLAEAEQNTLIQLQLDMLQYIGNALEAEKKSRRERSFDDLLLDVYHALIRSPHREQLAQTVAAVWKAALIDEFQDTDPLQYEIFKQLFIRQGNPLFLVGDPKQAIYSFRGADIYAYMQAAEDADARYTLTTNFRSHAKLINGIGALFKQKNRPFVLDSIDYADVNAARSESRLNPPKTAVSIRWLNHETDGGGNKDALRSRAADNCADEIAAVLNDAVAGRLNYQKNTAGPAVPLQSGQIAVLVRTHNEGQMIAKALKQRNIQSVLLQRESVFASEEAEAVDALIGFWLQPQRTETLRFVLGGILFRYTAAMIHELNRNETALLSWINSAQTAAEVWQQHGIYAAMQQFAAEHGIEARLLARGSTRSLTNYHQLIERLAEEDEQSRSPAALREWLKNQIQTAQNAEHPKGENNLLRLESDENLVKIVTMHAAKGLQYPLVYCPFVWDAKKNTPQGWQILHRPRRPTELLHETQLDDADRNQLADENLSENLRLLYVALTRAEEHLVIYAARCSHTPDNTFAYLLEGTADSRRADIAAAYAAAKSEADTMLKNNWQRFIDNAPENTDFSFTETPPEPAEYQAPSVSDGLYQAAGVSARPFEFIRHTSFTGLSRHTRNTDEHTREELQPAIDTAETATDAPLSSMPSEHTDTRSIHTFPRGASAGVCLHEILETFDFGSPAAAQSETVAATLEHYGFDAGWLPAVTAMLDHTRLSPLDGQTALADIPATQRLAEMGFTLFMHDFTLNRLQQWFAETEHGLPAECATAAKLLDFNDVNGFLNGFIDMVCRDSDGLVTVIDYKSNHLGYAAEDYTQAAMNEAVAHHHYYLQALIYAIATARHFASRQQPLHTVAVRYLFLRGLNGSGNNGIWSWNIDTSLLQEWL